MARDRPTEKSEDSGVWPHIFPQSLPVCDQSGAGETPINESWNLRRTIVSLFFFLISTLAKISTSVRWIILAQVDKRRVSLENEHFVLRKEVVSGFIQQHSEYYSTELGEE
jgi:hypothetical protein